VVDAPLTAPALALLLALLDDLLVVAAICLMTLAAPGVDSVVQCHSPLASAQVWPSLAMA